MDFLTIYFSHFLGFRELLTNFSPFNFSPLRFGGWGIFLAGVEFRRGEGGGLPFPVPPCQGMAGRKHISTTLFQISRGSGRFRHGEELPKPPQFNQPENPPKPHTGKLKREKFANSLWNRRKWVKKVKNQFSIEIF